jgi:hypothetical protein
MIRVYFDLNVLSVMKRGGYPKITEIIDKYRNILLIHYSSSHISDLKRGHNGSQERQNLINEDLEYILSVTQGHYLNYKSKEGVESNIQNPHQIFEDSLVNESAPWTNSREMIEFMSKTLNEAGYGFLNNYSNTLLWDMPLSSLWKGAFEDEHFKEYINILFPGLTDISNPTFADFMDVFIKQVELWNKTDKYKDTRELIQNLLNYNPDKLFGTDINRLNEPFKEIDGLISEIYEGKIYDDVIGYRSDLRKDQTKDYTWFDILIEDYIQLDMFGFRQDKVFVKPRERNTFANIIDDANHFAFASICDIYVTNDKKHSIPKVKAVYEKHNISTIACLPEEFAEIFEKLRFKAKDSLEFVNYLNEVMKSEKSWEGYPDDKKNAWIIEFKPEQKIFNFFNSVFLAFYSNNSIAKICRRQIKKSEDMPTKREMRTLLTTLTDYFGTDINNKGELTKEDLDKIWENTWEGRNWIIRKNITLHLQLTNDIFFDLFFIIKPNDL